MFRCWGQMMVATRRFFVLDNSKLPYSYLIITHFLLICEFFFRVQESWNWQTQDKRWSIFGVRWARFYLAVYKSVQCCNDHSSRCLFMHCCYICYRICDIAGKNIIAFFVLIFILICMMHVESDKILICFLL